MSLSSLRAVWLFIGIISIQTHAFKCPPKEYFIILGDECIINATHGNNPADTEYDWQIVDTVDIDMYSGSFLLINDEKMESWIKIWNDEEPGTLTIKLEMDSESHQGKPTICYTRIIFYYVPYFGIDLGQCIAYQMAQKNVRTERRETHIIIADKMRHEYCIPAAIYFPKNNNDNILFGYEAMSKLAFDATNVIYDMDKIIGKQLDNAVIQSFNYSHEFDIVGDNMDETKIKIVVPNRNIIISPEQALAAMIIHLIELATDELGIIIQNVSVVITIPAFFNTAQRNAVRRVAQIAKLDVKLYVMRPTAAAIGYSYYSIVPRDDLKLFMVFELGVGELDVSLMRCMGMSCMVLAVLGNSTLGRIDFDRVIKEIIIEKLVTHHSVNPKDIDSFRIMHDSEMVMEMLSNHGEYVYMYRGRGAHYHIIITREEFEYHPKTKMLLQEIMKVTQSVIGLYPDRITAMNVRMILMIGEDRNIPIIQHALSTAFDRGNTKIICSDMDNQLSIIKGAATLGGILAYDTGFSLVDAYNEIIDNITPLSLGFAACESNKCGLMVIVVPKNSMYPLQRNMSYCLEDPRQTEMTLSFYEGESNVVSENYHLGYLTLKNILPTTTTTKCNAFHIVWEIDENGITTVHGIVHKKDGSDGKIYTMNLSLLNKDGTVSNCKIIQMQNEMISWFKSNKIQHIFENITCNEVIEHSNQSILKTTVDVRCNCYLTTLLDINNEKMGNKDVLCYNWMIQKREGVTSTNCSSIESVLLASCNEQQFDLKSIISAISGCENVTAIYDSDIKLYGIYCKLDLNGKLLTDVVRICFNELWDVSSNYNWVGYYRTDYEKWKCQHHIGLPNLCTPHNKASKSKDRSQDNIGEEGYNRNPEMNLIMEMLKQIKESCGVHYHSHYGDQYIQKNCNGDLSCNDISGNNNFQNIKLQ